MEKYNIKAMADIFYDEIFENLDTVMIDVSNKDQEKVKGLIFKELIKKLLKEV